MKLFLKQIGIIAFITIIVLSLTACGGDDGGTTGGRKIGSVTISNFPSDYYFSFCLIYSNPSVEWNITNNSGYFHMVAKDTSSFINNGVHSNNDTTFNRVSVISQSGGDFTYTGGASVVITVIKYTEDENYNTIGMFGVNNVQFNNGHATIDFATVRLFYLPSSTDGKITLNNISENLNGKYVIMVGANASAALYGLCDASSVTVFEAVHINNTSVELPVYQIPVSNPTGFSSFNGSGEATSIVFIFMDTKDFDLTHYSANIGSYKYLSYVTVVNPISFSNGVATADFNNGTKTGTGW